jgi:hypothetical protein
MSRSEPHQPLPRTAGTMAHLDSPARGYGGWSIGQTRCPGSGGISNLSRPLSARAIPRFGAPQKPGQTAGAAPAKPRLCTGCQPALPRLSPDYAPATGLDCPGLAWRMPRLKAQVPVHGLDCRGYGTGAGAQLIAKPGALARSHARSRIGPPPPTFYRGGRPPTRGRPPSKAAMTSLASPSRSQAQPTCH